MAVRVDRRGVKRGDETRTALLAALEEMLREGVEIDRVQVAELTRRAGVTRSAFYFYFESKAMALAALLDDSYAAASDAGRVLVDTDRVPEERVESALRALLASIEDHLQIYLAMLAARGSNPGLAEMWEADRRSFVPMVAQMITDEREAGRAPAGPPSQQLAEALLELNDRALENHARAGGHTTDEQVDALVAIWVRSIYGS